MKEKGFNPDLLSKSNEERIAYFEAYTVAHPNLVKAYDKLLEAIRHAPKESIIMMWGPSGVGKSTLIKKLVNTINKENIEQIKNQGQIPIIRVELEPPSKGNYNWNDYYRKALREAEEPMLDKKISYSSALKEGVSGELLWKPSTMGPNYKESWEKAIYYRNIGIVVLDEAQNLTKISSGRKLEDQLDMIKSIANISQSSHVLVGSYQLTHLRYLNDQVARRTIVVHFPRYRFQNQDDRETFRKILNQLICQIPIEEKPSIAENWQYIYERTIGCIGTLKILLEISFKVALERGMKTISLELIEEFALSARACEKMARIAVQGEKDSVGGAEYEEALKTILYEEMYEVSEVAKQNKTKEDSSIKRKKTDVGMPKAARSPVGVA